MRPILLAAALLLLATTPLDAEDAAPLSSGYTAPEAPFRAGMWWNPDRSGAGMDIHLSGDRLFLVWYTYEADGLPVWYMAEGEWTGEAWTAPLQRFTWNSESGTASGTPVGEITLEFQGPTSATFNWTLGDDTGSQAIEPLLVSEGISVYDRTGHWYPPNESGYGLTVNQQGSVEFVVAYLYDANGEPRWLWADRTGELTQTHELVMFQGACPACDYDAPLPTASGSLTRDFSGRRTGTLTLNVNFPQPASGEWERTGIEINMLSNPPDGRSHPAAMATFASAEALETYLKRALAKQPPYPETGGIDFSPAPPRFSQTTTQEEGVDEADSIKTDGRVLYVVDSSGDEMGIRVLELQPEAAGVTEITRIAVDVDELALHELYLAKGGAEQESDLLVGVFHDELSTYFSPPWYNPHVWVGQSVEIRIWDVTVPSSPSLVSSVGMDGGFVESRRIGDTLYLVTRFTPELPAGLENDPDDEETVEANLALLEDIALEELLPDLRIDGEKVGELVDPTGTWLPPVQLDRETPNLVSISAIDLRATDPGAQVTTVVGQSEAIYVSPESLFLASMRHEYPVSHNLVQDYPPLVYTDIHKLALHAGGPQYRGSASVEGHLGHHQDRKSFRMGEHLDMLGVVTSSGGMWGNLGDHRLTMLQETPRTPEHRLLKEVAHLPNPDRPRTLGKPDELLYATRFLDDRLYVVTFKKTDPLYVVDLSKPRQPEIMGEVEVTGYSDFLYPVGDDLLVGIGLDAVPADELGDGRFAWFQGLKLGLFDVADPASPVELDSLVIGRRGTRSPALADHHAFSFLPEGNGLPARLAIPIQQHDAWANEVSQDPTYHYPWVRSGLFLFNVLDGDQHAPGLVHSGTLVTASRAPGHEGDGDANLDTEFTRSVIMDDSVFFVKDGDVWGAKWRSPNQSAGPQ